MLSAPPASVQERWFAGLYLLKPVVLGSLAIFWIGSGLASLGPGYTSGVAMMEQGGAAMLAPFAVIGGGLADIVIGGDSGPADSRSGPRGRDRGFPPLCDRRDHRHALAMARPARGAAEDRTNSGAPSRRPGDLEGPVITTYFVLKFLHVIGAVVLIGTGAGIAFMVMAHITGNLTKIAGVARMVVTADFLFTATAVMVQPITGVLLAREVGHPLSEGWIVLSTILYLVIGAFWLPVVVMQIRMRDLAEASEATGSDLPARYHRLFWIWFACGFPAFASILGILWLMIAKPPFPLFG
jgi:uncharacterized membrane protein